MPYLFILIIAKPPNFLRIVLEDNLGCIYKPIYFPFSDLWYRPNCSLIELEEDICRKSPKAQFNTVFKPHSGRSRVNRYNYLIDGTLVSDL